MITNKLLTYQITLAIIGLLLAACGGGPCALLPAGRPCSFHSRVRRGLNEEQEVERYLAQLAPEREEALRVLGQLIRHVVPEAVESMDYRMPTYRFTGNPLCALASRSQHMTLYIHTRVLPRYRDRLGGLSVGKERIRFKRLGDLPLETVRQIIHEAARIERA